jgi:2'-5' RNA ligase
MRIFIGIKLNETLLDKIEKFLKPLKKNHSPVKWVKRENLHITLKFIGEIPVKKYQEIQNILSQHNFNTGPLDLEVKGCGKFGKGNSLNILWVGINNNKKLEEIYNTIENLLDKAGIAKENRRFKPHITVGRNKKSYNFKSIFKIIEEKRFDFVSNFMVSHFQIFKSELTPDGPIYTIMKELSLVTT